MNKDGADLPRNIRTINNWPVSYGVINNVVKENLHL